MDAKANRTDFEQPRAVTWLCRLASGATLLTGVALAAPVQAAPAAAALRPGLSADRVTSESESRHRTFGLSLDLGVPDGAALGLSVRPKFDWLRLGAAVTYNGMAPGARVGVTLDPINFPIAPTFTAEGGHYWEGTIPGVKGSPTIGYNYANLHLGIEVGNRQSFRFFLRGGASWLDLTATNLQTGSSSSGIGNPSYNGWLAPSGKLGFSTYF